MIVDDIGIKKNMNIAFRKYTNYEKEDNRRKEEVFANKILDDVANRLADLLHELKAKRNSFTGVGIDYEEKAFYDILLAMSKKYAK